MKKGFKITAAAALAVSALTPVAALAAETTLAPGYYSDTFTPVSDFAKMKPSEKKAFLKANLGKANFVFIDGENNVYDFLGANGEKILNHTSEAELKTYATTVSAYETAKKVEISTTGIAKEKETAGELKVESVSAINAKEIQVKFTAPVTKASAETLTNYVFTVNNVKYGTGYTNPTTLLDATNPATLSEDGKTVTFRLADDAGASYAATKVLSYGDKFGVDVTDGVISTDGKKVERYGDTQRVYTDSSAPTITKTELKGDKKLYITFNEPIRSADADFGITIDGVEVNGAVVTGLVTAPTAALDYTYVVDISAATYNKLRSNGKHNVVLTNTRDHVKNNANVGNRAALLTTSYTVDTTQTQPAVTKLTAVDFNTIKIDFNKVVTDARIIVKKGNVTFLDTAATITGATTASQTVNLPLSVETPTGVTGLSYLYENGALASDVTVQVIDYKDATSLYGNSYSGSVQLKLDAEKPKAVTGVINGTTALEVQLNRSTELTAAAPNKLDVGTSADTNVPVASGLDVSKIKVTDKNGLVRTINSAGTNVDQTGKVTIALTGFGAGASDAKYADLAPFKVEFLAGAVAFNTDYIDVTSKKSLTPALDFTATEFYSTLKNDAFSISIGSSNAFYKAIEGVDLTGAGVTVTSNEITVPFTKEMGASATEVANYTLDGNALPAGTTVSIDGTAKVVTIKLPEGTFAGSDKRVLGISTDVKTKDNEHVVGNIASKEAYQSGLLSFTDNTKPVLVSAKLTGIDATDNTTNTIELTFSEEVVAAASTDDFVVIAHDGTRLAATATAVTAGDNTKKVTITLAGTAKVNASQTVKVLVAAKDAGTNPAIQTTDIALNEVQTGTVVTATK